MNKVYGLKDGFAPLREEYSRYVVCYGMAVEQDNVHATWQEVYVPKTQHPLMPTPMEVVEIIRQDLLEGLAEYDSSSAVDGFIIRTEQGDVEDWLDTKKRGDAQRAIDAAKKTGVKTLEYVIAGIPISLSVEDADMKLAQIEMYAVQCTAVTERHRVAILSLPAEKAVEGYDFTQGYPSKLVFPLGEANGTVESGGEDYTIKE